MKIIIYEFMFKNNKIMFFTIQYIEGLIILRRFVFIFKGNLI